MTVRVASSRLIGRSAELAVLETALADAADGRLSVAFVAREVRRLAEVDPPGPPRANAARRRAAAATPRQDG